MSFPGWDWATLYFSWAPWVSLAGVAKLTSSLQAPDDLSHFSYCGFCILAFSREEWRYGSSSKSFVLSTECRIQLPFPSPLCRGSSITSAMEVSDYIFCCSYTMLHLGKPIITAWEKYLEQYQISERLLLLTCFLSEVFRKCNRKPVIIFLIFSFALSKSPTVWWFYLVLYAFWLCGEAFQWWCMFSSWRLVIVLHAIH